MKRFLLRDKSPKKGLILFTFTAPAAREVSLVGSFNQWNAATMPMRKGADRVWHLNVPLGPGRHEYRLIADGVWRDDPGAAERIPNTFGSENCVRTISR